MEDRTVLHCDANCFFASVETALHPEYRGVPMAVCGSTEDRHGIVLAKNELAKRCGIQTAETVWSAKKKCPSLVIASPHYDDYLYFSKKLVEIYSEFTDQIESFGLDECWLDVTASRRFGDGLAIAEKIRAKVKETLGITVSIGVSFNKVFAKLGSDYKKPDAITVISRENFRRIVWPLPADSLLFVGKRTAGILAAANVRTVGDLASASEGWLENKLGKMGRELRKYALGEDDSPVCSVSPERKSIGNGLTFRKDLMTVEERRDGFSFLCEEIGEKLRRKKSKCTVVTVHIKDPELRVISKQKVLSAPTDLSDEIARAAYELYLNVWTPGRPVRMLNVTVSGLCKNEFITTQTDFFDTGEETKRREKIEKRESTVDALREKFGKNSIVRAAFVRSDLVCAEPKDEKTK